ncbi:MAG: hypothetical protein ACYC2E_06145 [Sulfuricella sp.]
MKPTRFQPVTKLPRLPASRENRRVAMLKPAGTAGATPSILGAGSLRRAAL